MENNDENQRLMELQQARTADESAAAKTPTTEVKEMLSFGKKVSEHWLILTTAIFFDILGIIPYFSVVFNFLFGLVMFIYFGPKKKAGQSELTKIGLPIMLGSVVDFFVGVLPVNIGAALIRISLS